LQQIEDYDAILKEIMIREGSAVTGTLSVRSLSNRDRIADLGQSGCEA
jgi:hypothetical protein